MTQFDHHSGSELEIDGARIYYEVHGDERAPSLFFLHGGLGTIEEFNPILPHLEGRFRLIGVDSRGQGRSTLGTSALTYARLEADVEHIADHLGVERFGVIGFSDGGIVGYRLAAKPGARVETLVTIGAAWALSEDDPVRKILAQVTADVWRQRFPASVETYERLNPQPDFERLVQAIVPMWLDSTETGYPGESVDKIRCPVLLVRGSEDHLVPHEALVELSKRVPSARLLTIPKAGHEAVPQPSELYVHNLKEFLSIT